MSDLSALEQRADAALAAFENYVTPLVNAGGSLTPEQRTQKDLLRERADEAADFLNVARKREERKRAAEAYRTSAADGIGPISEPTVYSLEGRHSYVVDRVFAERPSHPRQAAARARLDEHGRQIASMTAAGGDEARKIERYIRLEHRNNPSDAEAKIDQLRHAGAEVRSGVTTAAGSGGAWVVPVWLLDRTVYYNLPARPFLDALQPVGMPESGMTINVPAQTGPAAVGVHATQNSPIVEQDVTSSTIPLSVQPIMGAQTISIEDLERQSWGGSFDQMIMRSMQQAYDQEADTIALQAALAGATPLAYTGTFSMTTANGAGGFYEKLAGAITTVETAAGVLASPNALFLSSQRWAWMIAQSDANSRPLIVPTAQGPNNAAANAGIGQPQGLVGSMLGLDVYKDLSIPTIGTSPVTDQAVVLDTTKVLALEQAPVFETFPATLANQGSVYMRLHGYLAVGALQPSAVVSIQGSAMSVPQF